MNKHIKHLIVVLFICLSLFIVAIILKLVPNEKKYEDNKILLFQKDINSIKEILVSNEFGDYWVRYSDNEVLVKDISPQLINIDYVNMLLDECSNIECTSLVEKNAMDLSKYGLETPESKVIVNYDDGSTLKINIGKLEPISESKYITINNNKDVYLMKNNRTIRFCMPVEKYINFIIIPPNETQEVLKALQDITITGEQIPEPIEIKAVLPQREDIINISKSYGAVTHIITKPYLHEANQTTLTTITDSLFGLISEGIVDYNCTEEELAYYGFSSPSLRFEFDYKNGDRPVEHYDLKLVKTENNWIATLNDQGVVYKIADVSFLDVDYEKLVSKWFFSPVIIEIDRIEVNIDGKPYIFKINGDNIKDLSVTYGNNNIDVNLFRKYYNLLVSASIEDNVPIDYELVVDKPELSITYHYGEDKSDDTIKFYSTNILRRVLVETNGNIEFVTLSSFVEYVKNATNKLINSEDFETNWK